MSVLTRIKNNQITDSTILANTKIVPGSIVGSLFNSNLTMTSDVTITGNLTVQGSSTYLTVASTNTYVNDPLIVMNNAFTGTNTNDIGLLFNRGSDINQAIIWDESEDEFRLIATSETGTTYGAVTTSSFANLRIGNIAVQNSAAFGSISTTGNISAVNATLSGDIAVNGGDITTTATTFNLLNATATTLNIGGAAATLALGATSGTLTINNPTVVGTQTTQNLYNTTATTLNFAGAATTLTIGATSGTTQIRNALDVDLSLNARDLQATVIGNVTPAAATFTALTSQGTTNLSLTTATAINNTPIGNATPSTGAFTTLTSSGVTQVTNTTTATSVGTGAFRVSGGASVSGNLWVGGNINIVGNTFTLTGNSGVFYGDVNGFGALYAGVTGYTALPQTVFQVSADVNNYAQVNFENLNTGADASTDWVATAGNGADLNHYINMGITSPNWDGTQENSLKTAVKGNDGYLYVQGDAATGGNLVIGASTPNRTVSVIVGGNTASNVTAVYRAPGTTATSTVTGAVTVTGGMGLTGNLWIGGGTIAANTTTMDVFNTTSSTVNAFGAATTLTLGATTGTASIRNANIWVQNATTIDGASATVDLLNNATTVNAFDSATTANIGAGTGTFKINNPTLVGQQPTQNLYNTVATTMNFAGAATTLNLGASTGTATINNATINLEGNVNVNEVTPSTNTTSGALVVDGGVGIAGNLNVGQNVVITGNLTVQGDVTTLNTATLDVEDLNITVAKGAVDSAAANGAGLTVDGASATLLYNHATTSWDLNKITRVTDTTDTTNETSGALRVAGGVAIAKDLFVGGGDIITDETTFNLLNTTATTLNVGGSATALNLGATSGTLTLNNPTVVGTQTTQNLYNTTATSLNFAGAASALVIGATTGTANIRNATTNIIGNAVVGGTLAVTGLVTFTDDIAVNGGDITTTATSATVFNTTATTVDAFEAATTLNIGPNSGTLTLGNPTVVGTQTTQNLYNTTTTTLNFAGAATTLTVGGTSGTLSLRNANIWMPNATTVGGAQATVALFNTNTTTVDAFKAATDLEFGATTGTVTINNPTVVGTQTTQALYNTTTTTMNFAGAATSLVAGATTGTFSLRNANLHLPNATTIHSSQATVSLLNENVTTVNGFGAVTALTLGATNGIATVRNSTLSLPNATNIHVGQTSITFANTTATTVNAFGAASTLNFATTNSITTFRGNVGVNAVLYANSNIETTTFSNGALVVSGGVGISGNLQVQGAANVAGIYATTAIDSTSPTTGAIVITQGGLGVQGSIHSGNGAVINDNQTSDSFQVKGQFATTLIYVDSVTDTVTIGGSNTTPVSGATLRVNGTGAMILPVGTTSQRPGISGNVDVRGMIRINSSLNILEYYDGTAWQSSQGSFTVINSESFSGNGSANVFTMLGESTTSSTIVSINGIVQIPTTSYSVTGNVLTFTEAPETGDIIDVRRLSTTTTVDELSFAQNIFKANVDYAFISTGTVSTLPRLLVNNTGLVTVTGDMEVYGNLTVKGDTNGQINIGDSNTDNVAITAEINSNLVPNANNAYDLGSLTQRWKKVYSYATVHDQTPVNVPLSATPILIDTFSTSTYSSAKYLVQVKKANETQIAEILLVQDTANAFITTYGVLSSNVELGGFTANIGSGNVNVYYTSTTATNSNVKVHSTYIV